MSKSTHLIPKTTVRADDAEVLKAIQTTFDRALSTAFTDFRLGVRNEAGIVYREVTLDSLDQFAAFAHSLRKLGFTEQMDEDCGMFGGFDAAYQKA